MDISYDRIVKAFEMIDNDVSTVINSSESGVVFAAGINDGDFVYLAENNFYAKATADDPDKCVTVGVANVSNSTVVFAGKVKVSGAFSLNQPVFLSDVTPGTSTTTQTAKLLGYYLGNGYMYMLPTTHKRDVGLSEVKNLDQTNADNISSGTLSSDRLESNVTLDDEVNTATTSRIYLLPKYNYIINGGFHIWQRDLSQTNSGFGSDDRWSNGNLGSTITHSRQEFDPFDPDIPTKSKYYSRTVVNSVNGANNHVHKVQRILNLKLLAGKTVTLSFWARADSVKYIATEFSQNFGNGGSDVIRGIGVKKFLLNTNWQKFIHTFTVPSIDGKVIGDLDNTSIAFWFDAGSNFNTRTDNLGQQSGTFDLADIKLEDGDFATEFGDVSPEDELVRCLPYYETSGSESSDLMWSGTVSSGIDYYIAHNFRSIKITKPIISVGVRGVNFFHTPALFSHDKSGFIVAATSGGESSNAYFRISFDADAEF